MVSPWLSIHATVDGNQLSRFGCAEETVPEPAEASSAERCCRICFDGAESKDGEAPGWAVDSCVIIGQESIGARSVAEVIAIIMVDHRRFDPNMTYHSPVIPTKRAPAFWEPIARAID